MQYLLHQGLCWLVSPTSKEMLLHMKSRTHAMTIAGPLLFVLVVVGVPYSYFIVEACQPSGVSEFFSDIGAFYSREGC